VLWILCLDAETYATLQALRLERVELIALPELECADPALRAVRSTRQPVEYYWTCGPAFLLYVFQRQPRLEQLTYLDADLFFFGNPTPIFELLGTGSVLLFEHNFAPSVPAEARGPHRGRYNVGLLVFRNTAAGMSCLQTWRKQCLERCTYHPKTDRFGDQQYLDDWPTRYEGVVTLRPGTADLAPWNLDNYSLSAERGKPLVNGEPLLFFHFSRLRIITNWLYDPGLWRHRAHGSAVIRHHVYLPYVRELRAARRQIQRAGRKVRRLDSLRYGRQWPLTLWRMLRHRSFLVVTERFAF
jgi:hypothetical protein